MTKTKRSLAILAIAGMAIAMGVVGQLDLEEQRQAEEQYCRMVAMWKETGGQAGWPAYDGEEVCRE